ncbi:MFS transporter [Aquimarina hainanensis]|uniref:MFS transporter n=1 Tax=Aquimarina hainanensis TaxID=1578017 RepID=A0ABW5NEB4_9FLAO
MSGRIIPVIIIISTFCVQVSSGINYIIFPLTMQAQNYTTTWIGIVMSFEILATLLLFKHVSLAVRKLGITQTIVGASMIRMFCIYFLGMNESFIGWLLGVFMYGLATSMLLVVIQTWLNLMAKGKLKGLFLGLYSASLSLGIASGPVVLQFIDDMNVRFLLNSMLPVIPIFLLIGIRQKPSIHTDTTIRLGFIFKYAKIVMLSALLGGVCFFGLPSFLTIYGVANGLSYSESSLLVTMFMIGSVSIGTLVSSLSVFIDRIRIIYACVFISVICAVFLALAVYASLGVALIMLIIWGGCMGGIYATGLGYIGKVFRKEDQISANASFVFMDALGGFLGVCIIGSSMDLIGKEGLTYTIVIAATLYLIFITKRSISNL